MSIENTPQISPEFKQYTTFEDFIAEDFAEEEFQKLNPRDRRFIQSQFDNLGFGVNSISETIEDYNDFTNVDDERTSEAKTFLQLALNTFLNSRDSKANSMTDMGFGGYVKEKGYDLLNMPQELEIVDLGEIKGNSINTELKLNIGSTKFKKFKEEVESSFKDLN
jgi:hypothetical protein